MLVYFFILTLFSHIYNMHIKIIKTGEIQDLPQEQALKLLNKKTAIPHIEKREYRTAVIKVKK